MKLRLLGALAALSIAGTANAADLTPTEIVNRHVSSGGNVDAIMADYADDAVVLQQGHAFQGKEAIRGLFENMFKRPAGPAPSAPPSDASARPKMNVTKVWEEGNVGFMTWEMGPMKATEEFIVRDGKIQVQTIFMSGPPPGSPPPA
ncbi:MAG TPA: nuclear transport factor 2 family protein [Devosia sp.]|nr:nuclear transport factor 2 family protein [Sphingomonadaceae bacterium]HTO27608.1 nuclear transport factor 2 family protein [Devosia sp.]